MTAWLEVARHDIRQELRRPAHLGALLALALLLTALALLVFHDVRDPSAVAAGTLWITLALVASLGTVRSHQAHRDRGTLETLLLLPLDRSTLYLGTTASTLLLVLLVLPPVVLVLLAVQAIPLHAGTVLPLTLILLLGALGLVLPAGFLGALAARSSARELLAPVLLVPVAMPVLIGGVHGTLALLQGGGWTAARPEATLMAGYDLAVGALAWGLAPHAWEATP